MIPQNYSYQDRNSYFFETDSSEHLISNELQTEKIRKVCASLFPLTNEYKDFQGRYIRLWTCNKYELFASIIDQNNTLQIVPGHKIRNPLNPTEKSADLVNRLKTTLRKTWQLSYDIFTKEIYIWPELIAAANDKSLYQKPIDPNGEFIKAAAENRLFGDNPKGVLASSKTHEKQVYLVFLKMGKTVEVIYDKNGKDGKYYDAKVNGKSIEIKQANSLNKNTVATNVREGFKQNKPHDESGKKNPNTVLIYAVDTKATFDKAREFIDTARRQFAERGEEVPGDIEVWISKGSYLYPQKPRLLPYYPKGGGGFKEAVQQNGLTKSYNGSHPNNPMPARGATGGSIGGVGNEVGIIEGLFSTHEALLETEHLFYVPSLDGKIPFTDQELQQILRELAIGIYVHDTIPFFSLHFNDDKNMYPVIHPAYQHTLVGRVISMLDYYMKGFLNGAIFDESFVWQWQNTKTQDPAIFKQSLIDLKKYCQQHIPGELGTSYYSVRELIKVFENIEARDAPISEDSSGTAELSDYSGFRSSFRIIAKQNSIRKTENLFSLDGDFDVFYTIEPDPVYAEELRKFRDTHGTEPAGYQRLVKAYDAMKDLIKEMMPQLPLFRDMFEMLKVINFFSYYFKTLKQAGKIPELDPKYFANNSSCPPLFPHLPIRQIAKQQVAFNLGSLLNSLSAQEQIIVENYVKSATATSVPPANIVDMLASAYRQQFISSASFTLSDKFQNLDEYRTLAITQLQQVVQNALQIVIDAQTPLATLNTQQIAINNQAQAAINTQVLQTTQDLTQQSNQALATLNQNLQQVNNYIATGNNNINQLNHQLNTLPTAPHHLTYLQLLTFNGQITQARTDINNNITQITNAVQNLEAQRTQIQADIAQVPIRLQQAIATATATINGHVQQQVQPHLQLIATERQRIQTIVNNRGITSFNSFNYSRTIEDNTILTSEEQPIEELQGNKRIVGGCGLNVERKPYVTDPKAHDILNSSYYDVLSASTESFVVVPGKEKEKAEGYIFKLGIADFQAAQNEEYEWMQYLLPKQEVEQHAATSKAFYAIYQGQQDLFDQECLTASAIDWKAQDCNGVSLLHYAAAAESNHYLRHIIQKGVVLDVKDASGYTPLHYAAREGRLEHVHLLLYVCPQLLNTAATDGSTPLYLAVQNNRRSIVKMLTARNCDVNTRVNHGMAPLYCAVHHGYEEIALELLDVATIQVDLGIEDGTTPLYAAVEMGQLAVAQKLLQKGANINHQRIDTLAPIHIVAKQGTYDMCKLLLSQPNLNINLAVSSGKTALHFAVQYNHHNISVLLLEKRASPTIIGEDKETALMTAILHGNLGAAEYMIENHKDTVVSHGEISKRLIDFPDSKGRSPLRLALDMRLYAVIQDLLMNGVTLPAPYEFLIDMCTAQIDHLFIQEFIGKNRFTQDQLAKACLAAAKHGHKQMVSLFQMKYKVKDEIRDEAGRGIIHYSAKYDNVDGMRLFLKSKPEDLVQTDRTGRSIAAIAAEHGSHKVLELIMEEMRNRKISVDNQYCGDHLLLAAVNNGHEKAADVIMHKIPCTKIPLDKHGNHATHIAAKNGDVEMLALLKIRGVQMEVYNKHGRTAYHYAIEYKWEDVLSYILQRIHEFPLPIDLLHFAAAHGSKKIISKLMKRDYSVNRVLETSGETPIFHAIRHGNMEAIETLCSLGADLNIASRQGMTPLLLAAAEGQSVILNYLLSQSNADSTASLEGKSALHLAVKNGHSDCVVLLIQSGFNIHQTDRAGKTALNLAKEQGHLDVADILQGKGVELEHRKREVVQALLNGNKIKFFEMIKGLPLNKVMPFVIHGIKLNLSLHSLIVYAAPSKETRIGILSQFLKLAGVKKLPENPKDEKYAVAMAHIGLLENLKPAEKIAQDIGGVSLIHIYASFKEVSAEQLEKAIKNIANVDIEDKNGATPLFYAIEANDLEKVEALLKKGANPNHFNHSRITPLACAISKDKMLIVETLLKYGASIEQLITDNRIPYVNFAVSMERIEITEFLISNGASVKKASLRGLYPIHIAADKGNYSLLRLVHAAGGSLYSIDKKNLSVAHYAAQSMNVKILHYLQSYGINGQSRSLESKPSIRKSIKQQKGGLIPLHIAAQKGDIAMVKEMVNEGADGRIVSNDKLSNLSYAALSGNEEVLSFFAEYRALMNNKEYRTSAIIAVMLNDQVHQLKHLYKIKNPIEEMLNLQGHRGLHLAAIYGAVRCAEYLIQQGADINALDTDNLTPFAYAVLHKKLGFAHYLISNAEIDIAYKNSKNETYLHIAIKNNDIDMAALLIGQNCLLNEVDRAGMSPVHYAVQQGNYKLVDLLLASGVDIEQKTSNNQSVIDLIPNYADSLAQLIHDYREKMRAGKEKGDSRLHIAVRRKDVQFLNLLSVIEDIDAQNKKGSTGLHLALSLGDIRMIRRLLSKGADIALKDNKGRNAAFLAATKLYDLSLLQALYHMKADFAVENMQGETILSILSSKNTSESNKVLAHQMFDFVYANVSKQSKDVADQEMIEAIKKNDKKAFFALINKGHPIQGAHFSLTQLAIEHKALNLLGILVDWFHVDVNEKNTQGKSLIYIASKSKFAAGVNLLLSRGAIINEEILLDSYHDRDKEQFNLLNLYLKKQGVIECDIDQIKRACQLDCVPIYIQAFKGNSFSNLIINGEKALHLAIRKDCPHVAQFLMWCGADKNEADVNGNTPLHIAAKYQNIKIIELLLDQNVDLMSLNSEGFTPFSLLLEKERQNEGNPIVRLLLNKGTEINCKSDNLNQIQRAVIYNKPILFENLIELGASIPSYDSSCPFRDQWEGSLMLKHQRLSMLHTVYKRMCAGKDLHLKESFLNKVYRNCLESYPQYVKSLFNYQEDLKSISVSESLLIAIENNQKEVFKFLVAKRADFKNIPLLGSNPLYLALNKQDVEFIAPLYQRICKEYSITDSEKEALDKQLISAIEEGSLEKFIEVFAKGYALRSISDQGRAHLALAERYQRQDMVDYLKLLEPKLALQSVLVQPQPTVTQPQIGVDNSTSQHAPNSMPSQQPQASASQLDATTASNAANEPQGCRTQ